LLFDAEEPLLLLTFASWISSPVAESRDFIGGKDIAIGVYLDNTNWPALQWDPCLSLC
jgi:hypothetical protein